MKLIKIFCLSLHYSRSNRFFYADGAKVYQFKAKDSKIKPYPLFREYFKIFYMKKTGLNGYVHDFSADFNTTDISNIVDIHKYLIKKLDIKCLD